MTVISNKPATNLATSMLLDSSDPFSVLLRNFWGKHDQEYLFIRTETIDVPVEDDLSSLQPTTSTVLDIGDGTTIFPEQNSEMLVREGYLELGKWIKDDHTTPLR